MDLVLPLIFSLLDDPKSYLRASCVCVHWNAVAKEPAVRKAAFMHYWQLLSVLGKPRQPSFYETAGLSSFVHLHPVQRSDSLMQLAVRHGIGVPTLKRMNNLMTDHSLHSRTHLYIPVADRNQLRGRSVSFSFCPLAKREFAVLIGLHDDHQQQQQGASICNIKALPHQATANGQCSSSLKIDALQAKLCLMLGRSLHVDEATAKFYLDDAAGDVKAAMEAFAQDLAWEGTTPGPIRKVPVQRWIRGGDGAVSRPLKSPITGAD